MLVCGGGGGWLVLENGWMASWFGLPADRVDCLGNFTLWKSLDGQASNKRVIATTRLGTWQSHLTTEFGSGSNVQPLQMALIEMNVFPKDSFAAGFRQKSLDNERLALFKGNKGCGWISLRMFGYRNSLSYYIHSCILVTKNFVRVVRLVIQAELLGSIQRRMPPSPS